MQKLNDDRPGVHEAHLLRKRDNPLFPPAARAVGQRDLAAARLQDGLDRDSFMEEFRSLVERAVNIEPNAASDDVLAIKEALDHAYQKACALPGDQSEIRAAIRKLLAVIMRAVSAGIGNDAYAARQLEEEAMAREMHFSLQELPLVAALTHAQSPVAEDELVPSLLSEDDADLTRCLALFDENQLAAICHDGDSLLQRIDPDRTLDAAWRRLALIRQYYSEIGPPAEAN